MRDSNLSPLDPPFPLGWFMCSLASVAEFEEKIKCLFITPTADDSGAYRVRLHSAGVWQEITVDDYFPCFANAGPVFSRGIGNELWVLLLEKAYAKLHGSYYALRGGLAIEGLMDLTGCPGHRFDFRQEDVQAMLESGDMFRRLVAWDERKCVMSCSTAGEDKFSESTRPADGGLVPGHAYTLLGVLQLENGDQLVHVRNPWGSFEWNGAYGDNDPVWTDSLKQEVAEKTNEEVEDVIRENDGTFWMPFEELRTHFDAVAVTFCHTSGGEGWAEASVRTSLIDSTDFGAEPKHCMTLTLLQESEVMITMEQADTRTFGSPRFTDMAFTVLQPGVDATKAVVAYAWLESERQVRGLPPVRLSCCNPCRAPTIGPSDHRTIRRHVRHPWAQPSTHCRACFIPRQVSTSTKSNSGSISLPAGEYIIVPWASGCRLNKPEEGALGGTEWDDKTLRAVIPPPPSSSPSPKESQAQHTA